MSTWVLMAVLKALVSLHLSLPMTLVMLFNNSTATIGKDVPSRFVKIDLLVPEVLEALEAEAGLADAEASVEALAEVVAVSNPVVASEAALVAVVVDMVEETLEGEGVVLTMELEQFPQHLTLSPTMLLLVLKEARSSMFAT